MKHTVFTYDRLYVNGRRVKQIIKDEKGNYGCIAFVSFDSLYTSDEDVEKIVDRTFVRDEYFSMYQCAGQYNIGYMTNVEGRLQHVTEKQIEAALEWYKSLNKSKREIAGLKHEIEILTIEGKPGAKTRQRKIDSLQRTLHSQLRV